MSDFRSAELSDLAELASWIETAELCRQWAGTRVNFPIQLERLAEQIEFADADSWLLLRDGRPVGFGQIVPKPGGRLHLARLLVAPKIRGNGLGRELSERLVRIAQERSPSSISLNVFRENRVAVSLYQRLGFEPASRPESELDSSSRYMTLDPASLGAVHVKPERRRDRER